MSNALDSLVSPEKLNEVLGVFSACMALPVSLLDGNGFVLQSHGGTPAYCRRFQTQVLSESECVKTHLEAGRRAYELGESYIFTCAAQLNHIAFPLVSHDVLLGIILIGPFLMDTPDNTLLREPMERYGLRPALCLELYDDLQSIPIVSPDKVNRIGKLAQYLFLPLLGGDRLHMEENKGKLYQQSRINETIQKYKGQAENPRAYPYEKERALLVKVKTGNMQSAKAILNDLLADVLLVDGQDIEIIKSRSLELATLLSRVAIEGGAPANQIYNLNHQFLSRLRQLDHFDELCFALQEIVESFVSSVSLPMNDTGSASVREAVHFMALHYSEPLTLAMVAKKVSLSPTYLSALFTKTMGMSYQEYLARIRIEEAKLLLAATGYPLSHIAVSVGYSDQSSFSKAFKRLTGLTPNKYR